MCNFIRVFGILVISHPFQLRFWPKNIFLKGKICPTKRLKIQLDLTVESKSQLFYHNRLRSWPQLLSKGILNVMTLWSTIRSCCIYFLPFLSLKLVILLLFFNFFYFLFWHLFLRVNRGRTKYDINRCIYLSHIYVWLMHIYIYIYIWEGIYILLRF